MSTGAAHVAECRAPRKVAASPATRLFARMVNQYAETHANAAATTPAAHTAPIEPPIGPGAAHAVARALDFDDSDSHGLLAMF